MPFYYSDCGGNKNNFDSRDACESNCPPRIGKTLNWLFYDFIDKAHNHITHITGIIQRTRTVSKKKVQTHFHKSHVSKIFTKRGL